MTRGMRRIPPEPTPLADPGGRWHHGGMRAPRLSALVALAGLALLAGCSRAVVSTPPAVMKPPESPAPGLEEVGMASWYGMPHHGRRTASGEVYDMNRMTAAHKTLPFGTRVLVTNRDTKRTAEVRINDRGPFIKGRILDVSYAAARQLGVAAAGIFPVRLRIISLPGATTEAPSLWRFAWLVGLFIHRPGTDRAGPDRPGVEGLRPEVGGVAAVGAVSVANQTAYRVDLGSYSTPTKARTGVQPLAARGFPLLVVPR
jgi:peptidoglycan lytic transglycosylase